MPKLKAVFTALKPVLVELYQLVSALVAPATQLFKLIGNSLEFAVSFIEHPVKTSEKLVDDFVKNLKSKDKDIEESIATNITSSSLNTEGKEKSQESNIQKQTSIPESSIPKKTSIPDSSIPKKTSIPESSIPKKIDTSEEDDLYT